MARARPTLNLQEDVGILEIIPELCVPYSELQIKDKVGEGGCGKVYKAKHRRRGIVAFKKLTGNLYPNK